MKHFIYAFTLLTSFNSISQSELYVECHEQLSNWASNYVAIDGDLKEYGIRTGNPAIHVAIIDTNCNIWGTKFSATNTNMDHDFGQFNQEGSGLNRSEYFFVYRQDDVTELTYLDSLLNYWIPNDHTIAIWTPISFDYSSINNLYPPLANTLTNKWGTSVETNTIISLFGVQGDNASFTVDTPVSGSDSIVSLNTICLESTIGISEINAPKKELVKIVDLMGRETEYKPNVPLIYIYSDGTRQKKVKIEY